MREFSHTDFKNNIACDTAGNFGTGRFKSSFESEKSACFHGTDELPPETEPERQYYFIGEAARYADERCAATGRGPTYHVITFGCQMNARDSEKIRGILRAAGFCEAAGEEKADIVVINTCTVRESANTKVYGTLGRLKAAKIKNPDMIIAVCGCMTQDMSQARYIKEHYGFVDIIFGTHNIYKFAELLIRRIKTGKQVTEIYKDAKETVEALPADRKYPFKSGVNIMYGCDNFCSYCIVPFVRGRERSRRPGDIIAEIEKLAAGGVKEVMLLGQNVNSYGKNLSDFDGDLTSNGIERESPSPADSSPVTFADLLRRVAEVPGIERVRFMTSHPKDLSDELIKTVAENDKICKHIHLPLQSGSSAVLKRMNRHYTKEEYIALADKIRKAVPDISLTTDIIVGFPGETEEDFRETLDVVKRVRFDNAFTFLYSKRNGTPAASMPDQVPRDVAKRRFDELLSLVHMKAEQSAARRVGRVEKVLVEEQNSHDTSLMTGRLSANTLVHFPGDISLIGEIVQVRITKSMGFYYMGELTF